LTRSAYAAVPAASSRTTLVFEGEIGFLFVALALLAVAFLVVQHRRLLQSTSPAFASVLTGLRALLVVFLLAAILEPTVVTRRVAPLARRVNVLVDTSRSMSLPAESGVSRLDRAREVIEAVRGKVGRDGRIDVYGFDEQVTLLAADTLAKAQADGRGSDLKAALAALPDGGAGASTLVLTDGGRGAVATAGDAAPGGDLVFVDVGGGESLVDVRVGRLEVPDIGFSGKPVELAAVLAQDGLQGREATVSLKVDGRLVAVRSARLEAGETRVPFSWTPPAPGSFQLEVEAKPVAKEAVVENNHRQSTIRVVRDRTRVLFIAGSPSWNYRFLREALKTDASLDMISFIILRSPGDVVDAPQDELSLIPFPTQKLFNEELPNFDLVIFDNFPFRLYFPSQYLDNLRDRVKQGGAFWMWGGPHSFIEGTYRGTAVEEMLPFTLEGPNPGESYLAEPFAMRLPGSREDNPFFPVELPGGSAAPRPGLPALRGFNIVGPAREGAVVLGEHPDRLAGGRPQPIVAMRQFGKGRVMAVATDDLWRWGFTAAGSGMGNKAYLEFVRSSLRWLVNDQLLSQVRLTVSPDAVTAGASVRVRVRVLDASYRPAAEATVALRVTGPGGDATPLQALPTAEEGVFEAEYRVPSEGAFRFEAEGTGQTGRIGAGSLTVTAAGFQDELSDPVPDPSLLAGMAAAMGARLVRVAGDPDAAAAGALGGPAGREEHLVGEERRGIGLQPAVFLAVLALLGIDWFLRKRRRVE
jgi:hypothetical protein